MNSNWYSKFYQWSEFFKYLDRALKGLPYCNKKSKTARTLGFESSLEVQYLEDSDHSIKFTVWSSDHAWSWPENWGQYLKNLTLTELSMSSNFAAKSRGPYPPPAPIHLKRVPKKGHWYLKTSEAARFLFYFYHFRKRSYLELLIKFKKNGHTICDPYQFKKKIFSLRHHGVKLYWTKIGL